MEETVKEINKLKGLFLLSDKGKILIVGTVSQINLVTEKRTFFRWKTIRGKGLSVVLNGRVLPAVSEEGAILMLKALTEARRRYLTLLTDLQRHGCVIKTKR